MKTYIAGTVHYVTIGTANGEYPSECCASIVTGLYGDTSAVDITVFNKRGGTFPNRTILYSQEAIEGTWHQIGDPIHIY